MNPETPQFLTAHLPLKGKPVSNLSSTVSALQTLAGLRVYIARLLDPNSSSGRGEITVKTFLDLAPETCILVAHRNLFIAAEVVNRTEDYEIEEVEDFLWVVQKLDENPVAGNAEMAAKLAEVKKKKIAQAQAMAAAKELLAASGVSADEFIALFRA